MHDNIYTTDFGEVRISDDEIRTLQLAHDLRSELAGSPFLETPTVKRALARAAAIEEACYKVARYRWEHE